MSDKKQPLKGKVIQMSKAIEKKEETLPEELFDGLEGYGADFTSDEVTLPFIRMVQKMSPYLVEGDGNYIESSKAGQLVHTVNAKAYDTLTIIPLRFEHLKIQWRMRESGGGLINVFTPSDPELPATHKVENQNVVTDDPTSVIEDTLQYICQVFAPDGEDLGMSIVSCSKSQLKYARRWNVQLQSKKITLSSGRVIRAPLFSHSYTLSTIQESTQKNGMTQSWHSFKFGEGTLLTDQDMLQGCIALAKQVNDVKFAKAVDAPVVEVESSTEDFQM